MNRWSEGEVAELRRLYPDTKTKDIAEMLGRTHLSVYKKAVALGLRKSAECLFKTWSDVRRGELGSNWKGGVNRTSKGYNVVLTDDGYVMQHRIVMEEHLGRKMREDEVAHHINGIKTDNRIENLQLMTHGEHTTLHCIGSKRTAETRQKMSIAAKRRFQDKRNHPSYKNVDMSAAIALRRGGMTIRGICDMMGITAKTYYNKLEEA